MQLRQHDDSDVDMYESPDVDQSSDDEIIGAREVKLKNHRLPLTCVCLDSKNKFAFTASKDGSIIKWCLSTKKILNKVNSIKKNEAKKSQKLAERNHVKHINAIAISSDDKFLATGGWDRKVRIWSPTDLKWLHTFTLHRQEITTLAFRRGHHTLYSGSADKSVMLWTLEDDDNRCFVDSLIGHEAPITSMDTSRRERVLTAGGLDQSIRIWKIVEGAQTVFQSKHGSADVSKFIDDKTFVSGGEDGSIILWTTMKRSPLCNVTKAHGIDEKTKLNNWITSLATYQLKQGKKGSHEKPSKRMKLDDDVIAGGESNEDASDKEDKSDEDDDEEEQGEKIDEPHGPEIGQQAEALVASGSCNSKLHIWKLIKNNLVLHKSIDCPGFINDLQFTSDGKKIDCGLRHRASFWPLDGQEGDEELFTNF
uniref:U3 small nucleolar RNA-interacting protein 2 n=1 Tax=Aceria tosichella TaxID=561515 RepID=A0A6G1SBH1_9ACAR